MNTKNITTKSTVPEWKGWGKLEKISTAIILLCSIEIATMFFLWIFS